MSQLALHTNSPKRNRVHPQQFSLLVAFASITMMFIALTSAYIVKQGAGNWHEFGVPTLFYISTAVLLLSSVTLHVSYISFKKGKEGLYKSLLVVTMFLGMGFIACQYNGWMEMFANGVDMKKNVSGSFFYLITGVHAAHILGGIAAIIVACLHAFTLKFKVTQKRKLRFSLVVLYWHFVDFLWIYLLGFLIFYR